MTGVAHLRALAERLNASTRDCVTGEPLYDDARPDIYVDTAREIAAALTSLLDENQRLVAALDNAEAVMSIVSPRSHTKEYLACLAQIRKAHDAEA